MPLLREQFQSSSYRAVGLFLLIQACLTALCSGVALDCVDDLGGAVVNGICYIFSSVEVSCTDKCIEVGTTCNEAALAMDNQGCLEVITALGIDLATTTHSWFYNFGSSIFPTLYFTSSVFDENVFRFVTGSNGNFRTMGCVVSPVYDATDQDSFTTGPGNINFVGNKRDALEAHNFEVYPPTCDLSSPVLRRVCSCTIPTPAPTPAPTISPVPPPLPNPTTAPAEPATPPPPTPPPPTPPPPTPPPRTPPPTPVPSQSNYYPSALAEGGGYWRTRGSSSDVRPCPIPDLCLGGTGGGDDLCFGNNTGPYCMVCPSAYFASVSGVCLECGSASGVTTVQVAGFLLAVCLLMVAVTLVGPCVLMKTSATGNDDTPPVEPLPLFSITAGATPQSALTTLRQKLLELGLLVACLRRDLTGTFSHQLDAQLQDLLVTIEMFLLKLIRILPRVPEADPDRTMKRAISNAQLLCPVIDQLAAGLAGLSGAASMEATTVILHVRSVLATARTLDPSAYLQNVPTNDAASVAKVVVSFVQILASVPLALVVRHSDSLRYFLGGLDIANFSVPKAFSIACLIETNFYGELVYKTTAPILLAVVICGAEWIYRLRSTITNREGRGRAITRTECLLALTYLVVTPATNAALRGLPCETFDDGTTMLRADYSIDCDATAHTKYRVLAATMAVAYPFGVFAFYVFTLLRHRQLLYPNQVRGRPKEDKAIAEEAKRLNELALQPFAILHDAYEPRAWWFEVFETFRRIALTSLVYFAAATTSQLWMAMLLTVLSLAMNVVFSPFTGSVNDLIYSGAQYVTLVVLALALTVDAETEYERDITSELIGWAIVVLMAGYIIVALVVLAAKWAHRSKAGHHLYAAPWDLKGASSSEGDERDTPASSTRKRFCPQRPSGHNKPWSQVSSLLTLRVLSSLGPTRVQDQSLDGTPTDVPFSSLHGDDEEGGEGAGASHGHPAHVGMGGVISTRKEENLDNTSLQKMGSRRRLKGSWPRDSHPSAAVTDIHQRLTRPKRNSRTRRLIPINTRTDEALSDRSNPYEVDSKERETEGLIRWEATTGSSSSPPQK